MDDAKAKAVDRELTADRIDEVKMKTINGTQCARLFFIGHETICEESMELHQLKLQETVYGKSQLRVVYLLAQFVCGRAFITTTASSRISFW